MEMRGQRAWLYMMAVIGKWYLLAQQYRRKMNAYMEAAKVHAQLGIDMTIEIAAYSMHGNF